MSIDSYYDYIKRNQALSFKDFRYLHLCQEVVIALGLDPSCDPSNEIHMTLVYKIGEIVEITQNLKEEAPTND